MITFNNIVERFEIFAENHFFIKSFSFGSPDDVDLSKFTSFPLMHLVYTGATYDAGTKTYNLEVYILDVPADKNSKELRQKEVVSDAEQCAEDIIADIKNGGNIFLFAQDYEVVNATTTPLEEETKNVLSGVLLDLSVSIPYEWDACNAPINGVEPGGTEITYARRGVLRMLTVDGATDVTSVRTIKVTNGTLTDDGDGVVRLDTGGAEYLSDLQDVSKLTPTAGYALTWSGSEWQPQALPSPPPAPVTSVNTQTGDVSLSLDDLTDVDAGAPTTGQLLAYGQGDWTTISQDEITIGIENVTGLQAELNTIPDGIFDLDDVTQSGGTIAADSYLRYINGVWTNSAPPAPTPVYDELGELLDVTLTSPADNDFLRYNGTVWVNESITQYHNRYQTTAESLRAGATATTELYYTAQADGDGFAESASSDTPTAGYDIQRKLYYSEAAQADPDTGTWVQFAAIADNTTFANAKAALLAYLKDRTGGTVPISLKQTWEEVQQAPSFTGLLNESYGSGAEAAYSTRRLNGNVSECMVIRRASDSTTTTIGFDGSGNIDESAIETFCTGTTCTVVTWKDQSGNGNDATQSTPTKQPTIYTGGALVKKGGRLALDFDTTDVLIASSITINGQRSDFAVVTIDDITRANGIFTTDEVNDGTTQTGRYAQNIKINWSTGVTATMRNLSFTSSNVVANAASDGVQQGVRHLLNGQYSGTTLSGYIDGVAKGSTTQTDQKTGTSNLAIGVSYRNDQEFLDGKIQELITFQADKASVRTDIESNIGDYFTQNTPLLDTYSGAAACYSLRLMRSAYTGSAVEVYNGSSYADIGFNVFGELDTVALAAHCGSNDGFVSKLYDQSGGTIGDLVQTSTSLMRKIYDGATGYLGYLEKVGNGGYYRPSASSTISQPFSIFGVYDFGGLPDDYFIDSYGSTNRVAILDDSIQNGTLIYDGGGIYGARNITGTTITSAVFNGANSAVSVNGETAVTGTLTGNFDFITLGARYTGTGTSAVDKIYEFVLYENAKNDADRVGIQDNLNGYYSAY